MKRWLTTLALLAGWAGLGAHAAMAQPYMPPQTNPYPTQGLPPALYMIPNNPYIQYYGLGQGQANNARGLQQLQQQFNQTTSSYPLGMGGANGMQPNMLMTGHPVTFQNTSHYFPTGGQPFAGMGMGMGMGMGGVGYPGAGGYGGVGGYPGVGGGYGGVGGYGGLGYGGLGGYGVGGFGYGIGGGLGPNVNTPLPQGSAQFPR